MGGLKVVVGPSRQDAYKCFVAAQFAKTPIKAVKVSDMPQTVFRTPCLLSKENVPISGSTAVCKYLMECASPTVGPDDSMLFLGEKLSLYSSFLNDESGGTYLQELQGYLSSKAETADVTLADVVVASSLLSAKNVKENVDYLQKFPDVMNWVDGMAELPEFKKGMKDADAAHGKFYSGFNLDNRLALPDETLANSLSSICKNAAFEAFPMLGEEFQVQVEEGKPSKELKTIPPEYQLSVAMKICGMLKGKPEMSKIRSPRDVAEILIAQLKANKYFMEVICESMEITGPGFINIYFKADFITRNVADIITKGKPTQSKLDKSCKVGVDFSSPNVAKEMHVGHLRSTIIGDCICRILAYRGHEVKRINHLGDWGTQFGMLLTYLKDTNTNVDEENTAIKELNAIYKAAKKKFDEDEDFKTRSRQEVVKLQSGEEGARKMWKKLIAVSEKAFNKVYSKLDIDFPDGYCGESFYQSRIPATVEDLTKLGLVEDYEGAKIIKTSLSKAPLFVQKSDGGYGYDSTDMTSIRYRTQELNLNWLVYVCDLGQSLHFNSCFEVAKKAKYLNNVRHEFVGFGLVLGADGKRFRSRSGETVPLSQLLDEAKNRIEKELEERVAKGETPLKKEDISDAAGVIGYAAVKYADLKSSKEKDYIFDYDRMLQPTGDTGVYILYTYARLCSLESKVEQYTGRKVSDILESKKNKLVIDRSRPREWEMVSLLLRYADTIEKTSDTLSPHILCSYVYELCVGVSKFLPVHRILVSVEGQETKSLNPDHGEDWVCLLHAVRLTLKELAPLLGMGLLERI
eukprot:CAMPEP_0184028690 /NCGR_PEP_ID=MMETSP0954-20121128/14993_1 /TAXON_ID=627963 /ORGANISM="Aplanochytrium sp, Strain PBS07" /LENGTH=801 /DNA_ID=CAMNT_0026313587 /DNA_START=1 /DNA_END=2406 /DNA_ORIENTATION=-